MILRVNSKNNLRVINYFLSICGVDLFSKFCYFLVYMLVFFLISWVMFFFFGRLLCMFVFGVMLGMGVDDMEWGVMFVRFDLGGKLELGFVEGVVWVGGYGFIVGYVCGWGVSGGLVGGWFIFIVVWWGKEG